MAYEKVNLNVVRRVGSLLSCSSGRKWGYSLETNRNQRLDSLFNVSVTGQFF